MPEKFSDPIWYFRLGKCSIVLSRVWAIIAGTVIFGSCCYYVYLNPTFKVDGAIFESEGDGHMITESWEEYLQDCGGEKVIENYVHTKKEFAHKYEDNKV
jgi:hypothetical protein